MSRGKLIGRMPKVETPTPGNAQKAIMTGVRVAAGAIDGGNLDAARAALETSLELGPAARQTPSQTMQLRHAIANIATYKTGADLLAALDKVSIELP